MGAVLTGVYPSDGRGFARAAATLFMVMARALPPLQSTLVDITYALLFGEVASFIGNDGL
tara:strand:+ start:359 stop:538 length:180 start_codon:yes stop_codon:yes gene_type:complete